LSYSEHGELWKDYLNRVNKTRTSFANINHICEDTILSMMQIYSAIFESVETSLGTRKLPNYQAFVSIYYKRNVTYLQSSHILACIGFIDPSSNLNRTVYETILRGYLFIAEPKEADGYSQAIRTEKEESRQFRKSMKYIRETLYSPKTREQHEYFYKQLCISAHADIKGAALDYPEYRPDRIEGNLSIILHLMYGDIQMLSECFFNLLNSQARKIIKPSMERIATTLKYVPLFEPDKDPYASRINLKRGNFRKF